MRTSTIRRKRQIEGRQHNERVNVYLSPEEKEALRLAAQRAEMSVSQFAVIAIKAALNNVRKKLTVKFNPVEIRGEALSATIKRERR